MPFSALADQPARGDATGGPGVDYRITDAYSDPPGATDRFHTERLVRLDGASWCYRPSAPTPDVGPLPALTRGHMTFGNLNNAIQTGDPAAATWAAVLRRVPAARLLLLTPRGTEGHVVRRFALPGVDPGRLVLVNGLPRQAYLATYDEVDVGLDPFPFTGDDTTCDAMWMGVPTVTLAGRAFWSRRGVSHRSNVGLADLVAATPEQYAGIAGRLAGNPPRLADLRLGLRERVRRSPLGDPPRTSASRRRRTAACGATGARRGRSAGSCHARRPVGLPGDVRDSGPSAVKRVHGNVGRALPAATRLWRAVPALHLGLSPFRIFDGAGCPVERRSPLPSHPLLPHDLTARLAIPTSAAAVALGGWMAARTFGPAGLPGYGRGSGCDAVTRGR